MTSWLRLWHEMPSDPKWRVIAKKSGQSISTVIAVYNFLLVNASANANERGRTHNWSDDDVAAALDISDEDIHRVIQAMQGKVLENDKLLGWEKRQPKREDSSAERAKQWRERKRTQRDAAERPEQSRAETEKILPPYPLKTKNNKENNNEKPNRAEAARISALSGLEG